MGAGAGVQAILGEAKPLNRPSGNQVLGDNLLGIRSPHIAVPDGLRVDHDHRPVLALVQAARLVDANLPGQPGSLGELLQAGVQVAASVAGARGPGRARGAGVVANKNVAFEGGQAALLKDAVSA